MVNLAALTHLESPKYRTALDWFNDFDHDERIFLERLILTHPSRSLLPALRENADFPFKLTALKDLRTTLKNKEDA